MHVRFGLTSVAVAVLLAAWIPARSANDPEYGRQWNLPLIGAETAWTTGTGKGITIAVVDTGVDLNHEDLKDRVRPGRNFVTPNQPPQDDNGHGTHVAGIAAASANNGRGVAGTAPHATILPVKVLDEDGSGFYSVFATGIRWAADNGAHVVNLSLGSTVSSITGSPSEFVDAIRYAWSKGTICIVAAGNDFVLSSDFGDEPAIVVSATKRDDRVATYSNGVGAADWGIAAPGGAGEFDADDDILSTYWPHVDAFTRYESYETLAGTSMAAPHVAGAAAVLRSLGLSPQQTVDRLLTTAKDLGSRGNDNVYGHGRLDVAKAVSGATTTGGATSGTGTASSTGTTSSTTADRSANGGVVRSSGAGPPAAQGVGAPGTGPASGSESGATTDESDSDAGGLSGGSSETAAPADPATGSRLPWGPPLAAAGLATAVMLGAFMARRAPAPRRRSTST